MSRNPLVQQSYQLSPEQQARLAGTFSPGTWGHSKPPRQPSRSLSRVRLSPLGQDVPRTPTPTGQSPRDSMPSPGTIGRQRSGHLGTMNHMRRSSPSSARSWWQLDKLDVDNLVSSWNEQNAGKDGSPPDIRMNRTQETFRLRRSRHPADFGSPMSTKRSMRGRSCNASSSTCKGSQASANVANEPHQSSANSSTAQEGKKPMQTRSESVPPTGTDKADDQARITAKARAVATLQKLFFEEMAKGNTDANSAAASALRRLAELPQEGEACSAQSSSPTGKIGEEVKEHSDFRGTEIKRKDVVKNAGVEDAAALNRSSSQQSMLTQSRSPLPPRPPRLEGHCQRPHVRPSVAVRN